MYISLFIKQNFGFKTTLSDIKGLRKVWFLNLKKTLFLSFVPNKYYRIYSFKIKIT